MDFVSIGRGEKEIKLFDTAGGIVKLYTSLTAQQNIDLGQKYPDMKDMSKMTDRAIEVVVMCFLSWNIGKDGVALPCDSETLKKFTQRDLFAMLQVATGIQLLDESGNMLTPDEIAKKGKSV